MYPKYKLGQLVTYAGWRAKHYGLNKRDFSAIRQIHEVTYKHRGKVLHKIKYAITPCFDIFEESELISYDEWKRKKVK